MSRILIIALLLIATSQGICQPVTSPSDSTKLIGVPHWILKNVIKDLNEGDVAREQVVALNEQIEYQQKYVTLSDSVNKIYRKQIVEWQNISQDKDQYITSYKLQLDKVARQSENRRKWLSYFVIAFTSTLIINFTH